MSGKIILAKSRKPNLSLREKEALISGIIKRKYKVQVDPSSPNYGIQFEEAWDQVTREVNAVNSSGSERTKNDIQKKFRNWKSDIKQMLARIQKSKNLTGGGEMDVSILNPTDQLMARMITKEEVVGVEDGMDIGVQLIEKTTVAVTIIYSIIVYKIVIFVYYNALQNVSAESINEEESSEEVNSKSQRNSPLSYVSGASTPNVISKAASSGVDGGLTSLAAACSSALNRDNKLESSLLLSSSRSKANKGERTSGP